jgi:hypothetical protein
MTLGKHGLRALGLSLLAALGLMAVGAAGASGETGKLLILNAAKTVLTELNATLGAKIDLLIVFHVPAINLEIHCTSVEAQESVYLASDHVAHLKLVYHGCLIDQLNPLTTIVGCEVYPTAADRTAGTNKGLIEVKGLLLVLLHRHTVFGQTLEKPVLRIKELHSSLFFKNCPTGSTALVSGGLTLLAHDGPETHKVEHLFEEAVGPAKLDQFKYGLSDMNMLGSIWIFLTGEHLGREWGLC